MSATADVSSANTTTKSSPILNTDHPFWQIIRTVPDFPKVGIDFYDITPLLRSHINAVIDEMLAVLPAGLLDDVDCLGAVEARGFVFASLLAGRLGKDMLEMQNNLPPERVLLVDDILATGGTLMTAYELCKSAKHTVVGALVLLDLVDLHGEFPVPVYTVLKA